jgi:hypothetical protein
VLAVTTAVAVTMGAGDTPLALLSVAIVVSFYLNNFGTHADPWENRLLPFYLGLIIATDFYVATSCVESRHTTRVYTLYMYVS